jgi:hypothetical protein
MLALLSSGLQHVVSALSLLNSFTMSTFLGGIVVAAIPKASNEPQIINAAAHGN